MSDTAAPPIYDREHPAPFPAQKYDLPSWKLRAEHVRLQIQVSLGLWPMPPRPAVKADIFGEVRHESFTVSKVIFESLPGHYVSGNLYRPQNPTGPCPAILNPHGHWKNGRLMWNDTGAENEVLTGGERDINSAVSPLQARSNMLASMGCIVFIYDMVGFGDSQALQHGIGFDDADAALHLHSFMGLQIWNGLRSLDFLYDLPGVDRNRIGVTGASSGALQSTILAALDDRIHATAAVAMIGLNKQGGCICENAPLLRVDTNNVEFAATIAPRPIGFASANDWTHDFADRGLPELRHIFGLHGAADRVEHTHVPFKHNCNVHSREFVYRFFNRHLKLGMTEPIQERPIAPLPLRKISMAIELAKKSASKGASELRRYQVARDEQTLANVDSSSVAKVLEIILGRERQTRSVPNAFVDSTGSTVGVILCPGETNLILDREAEDIRERGYAILLAHLPPPLPVPADQSIAFTMGYNRCPLTERVNGILAAVAAAQARCPGVPIHLIGPAPFGQAAVLAAMLLGGGRVIADFHGSDWTAALTPADSNFLPGSAKYSTLIARMISEHQGPLRILRSQDSASSSGEETAAIAMLRWIADQG